MPWGDPHLSHSVTLPEPRHSGKAIVTQFSGNDSASEIRKKMYTRQRACWGCVVLIFSIWEREIGILVQEMIKVLFSMLCLFCYFFFPMRIAITNLGCKLLSWEALSYSAAGLLGRGPLPQSRAVLTRRGEQAQPRTQRSKRKTKNCRRQFDPPFPVIVVRSCPCLVGIADPPYNVEEK